VRADHRDPIPPLRHRTGALRGCFYFNFRPADDQVARGGEIASPVETAVDRSRPATTGGAPRPVAATGALSRLHDSPATSPACDQDKRAMPSVMRRRARSAGFAATRYRQTSISIGIIFQIF